MATFIFLDCKQPVHLRTASTQVIPPELQYCLRCERANLLVPGEQALRDYRRTGQTSPAGKRERWKHELRGRSMFLPPG